MPSKTLQRQVRTRKGSYPIFIGKNDNGDFEATCLYLDDARVLHVPGESCAPAQFKRKLFASNSFDDLENKIIEWAAPYFGKGTKLELPA